jgi:Domain of unknown function (DUF4386)
MPTAADTSPRNWARAVGFLYLLMSAGGLIPLLAGRLHMSNDVAATAAAILAHPDQVHAAFAANLLVVVCYLPVPALLYKIFKPVDDTLSLIAAFFGVLGCTVQALASLFGIAPLVVLTSGQSATGIDQRQVQALAYLLLKLYTPAYSIGLVFFAVAMIVIGWLAFKSTFMPRIIGALAMISGVGWLVFLWPPLAKALWPRVILPLDFGEIALILWLLIVGVNLERWHDQAGRSARSDAAAANA